jgi:hypothetical protein
MVSLQTTDQIAGECEHLAKRKRHLLAAFFGNVAPTGYRDTIPLLDQMLKDESGTAFKSLVFYLGVERILAVEGLVAMQHPNNIVSQARQNPSVISVAKSFNIFFDNSFASGHTIFVMRPKDWLGRNG